MSATSQVTNQDPTTSRHQNIIASNDPTTFRHQNIELNRNGFETKMVDEYRLAVSINTKMHKIGTE
jgi:hypothetical protein